ncbi:MAG: hypothetical protein KDE19_22440 [Caldilineaceae bacterium]|nr:hypothetical protein [Caldilineaceae bacterium]
MYLPNTAQVLINAQERQMTLTREAQRYRQIQQAGQRQSQSKHPSGRPETMRVAWHRLLVGGTLIAGVLLSLQ